MSSKLIVTFFPIVSPVSHGASVQLPSQGAQGFRLFVEYVQCGASFGHELVDAPPRLSREGRVLVVVAVVRVLEGDAVAIPESSQSSQLRRPSACRGRTDFQGRAKQRPGLFHMQALDGRTGDLIWENHYGTDGDGAAMRGIAIYGDKIFAATSQAHLMAFDARTGRTLWNTTIGDRTKGEYITSSGPLAVWRNHGL